MRHALFGGIMGCVLVVAAATSRSDAPPPEEAPPPAIDLGSPATVPLGANPPHDPATPYDPGPPDAIWRPQDLTVAERAQVERDDATDWRRVHDAYGAAVDLSAKDATARVAQALLGLSGQGDTGVVP